MLACDLYLKGALWPKAQDLRTSYKYLLVLLETNTSVQSKLYCGKELTYRTSALQKKHSSVAEAQSRGKVLP